MTTVAAIARHGQVHMAGDSMTNVYDRPVFGARKVIKFCVANSLEQPDTAEFLVGFAGDGAFPALLATHLKVERAPSPDGDAQRWADAIAQACTQIAMEGHITDDGRVTSTLLLGWNGCLWTLTHNQAIRHTDGVAAVGSGEGPAIGAIDYALATGYEGDIGQLLRRAVGIGIRRDKHSGGHVTYEHC